MSDRRDAGQTGAPGPAAGQPIEDPIATEPIVEPMTQAVDPAVLPGADGWQSRPEIRIAQRRSMRLLIISQVLGSFGTGASPSVGVLLAEQVTDSETLAGVARTAMTLGAAVFGIPLALLAARGGRRVSLATGWFLAALGSAALVGAAMTESAALLVGGMLLFGAGTAAGLQSRFAATDLELPERRGRTLSLVVWSGTLGSVFGPNLGDPGAFVSDRLGLPPLAGAFVISAVILVLGGALMIIGLRPDPLLTATRYEVRAGRPAVRRSFRQVLPALWSIRPARFALLAIIAAHLSMISLMTMTPVQMHHHGSSLTVVGITISIHVLGMFALAPLIGWSSDRIGPVRVILIGQLIFIASSVAAIISDGSEGWTMISLFLLGLGWSCGTVPGSILLSEVVPADIRPSAQGLVDTTMNGFAALAALLSGPIFALIGFGGLSVLAVVVALPLMAYAMVVERRITAEGSVDS